MKDYNLAVSRSDLEKIDDALMAARQFFESRDEMNAAVHLGEPRFSPITSLIVSEQQRVRGILNNAAANEA